MVDYMHFRSEETMLMAFLQYWNENCPDVVTGWNVQLFDIPYIARRIDRILGEKFTKTLVSWVLAISSREIVIKGRKQIAYDLPGISTLDYFDLYRKFTCTNQESYRLDHIAFVELGQKWITLSTIRSKNSTRTIGKSLLSTTFMTFVWLIDWMTR